MTWASRKQRRDQFSQEHFDTEDRLDRAIAGVALIVFAVLALGLVRVFVLARYGW